MITAESSQTDVLEEIERIRHLYRLKTTLRYESVRDPRHSESVAEHIFGMYILVDYFLPLDDPHGALNREHIRDLILNHEIGEIETGDIISHKKTEEQKKIERGAAARVAQRLPEHLSRKAFVLFEEFEYQTTPEARFACAIDKLEPIFEMIPSERWPYFKRHNMNKEVSVGKKMDAVRDYPHMLRFLDVWTEHLESNSVFVE